MNKKDKQLLAEAYRSLFEAKEGIDGLKTDFDIGPEEVYQEEPQLEEPVPPASRGRLASRLFERLIDGLGDNELERMHNEIAALKKNASRTYLNLKTQPFSKDIIEMIEDEYAYRQQDLG